MSKKVVAQNVFVVLLTQIIRMVITFIVRTFFVSQLGEVYLGYNSVFTNLLSLLNLSELGIGVAIISYMYEPLLQNDSEKVNALMWIYKRIYSIIGICIFAIGIVISLFLPFIIKDSVQDYNYIRIYFYIYLIGTVASYFLAYKRNYVIAIEKNYIVSLCDSFTEILFSLIQIVALCAFKSYAGYITFHVLKIFVANIIISFYVSRKIHFEVRIPNMEIVGYYRPKITSFVKDVFVSKVGGCIFNSTDAIICSIVLGVVLTGKFDNYVFIYTAMQSIIVLVFNAVQSSYGYYIHSNSDLRKQEDMFFNYEFICFFVGTVCMYGTRYLVNPLIKIWFGEQYVINEWVAIVMGINILLNMFIQLLSQAFTIYQLYHYDKVIVCISAVSNIVISYLLAQKIDVAGIVLGTTITSCIYIISRLYVMYKYVFKTTCVRQLKKLLVYAINDIIIGIILDTVMRNRGITGFMSLIANGIFIVLLISIYLVAVFARSREVRFVIKH